MSWQAISWQEISNQARLAAIAERLQPAVDWTGSASTEALRLFAAILPPMALGFAVMAFWRLGSDLGVFGEFYAEEGTFSHWQVWIALALGAQFASVRLHRKLKQTAR